MTKRAACAVSVLFSLACDPPEQVETAPVDAAGVGKADGSNQACSSGQTLWESGCSVGTSATVRPTALTSGVSSRVAAAFSYKGGNGSCFGAQVRASEGAAAIASMQGGARSWSRAVEATLSPGPGWGSSSNIAAVQVTGLHVAEDGRVYAAGTFNGQLRTRFPIVHLVPHTDPKWTQGFVASFEPDGTPRYFSSHGGDRFHYVDDLRLLAVDDDLVLVAAISGDVRFGDSPIDSDGGALVFVSLDEEGQPTEIDQFAPGAAIRIASASANGSEVTLLANFERDLDTGTDVLDGEGVRAIALCDIDLSADEGAMACSTYGGMEARTERGYQHATRLDGDRWFSWYTDATRMESAVPMQPGGTVALVDADRQEVASFRWPYMLAYGLAADPGSGDAFVAGTDSPFGAAQSGEQILPDATRFLARVSADEGVVWAQESAGLLTSLIVTAQGQLVAAGQDPDPNTGAPRRAFVRGYCP